MRRLQALAIPVALLLIAACSTATVLPDGRVLFLSEIAKIYDPSAGILHNAAFPSPFRVWNSTTLLNDGHVLLVGGLTADTSGGSAASGAVTNTASLYDPGSDTYQATGSMAQGRLLHTATLLQDGRVLVAGGSTVGISATSGAGSSSAPPVAIAEIYDPGSGTFSTTGSLVTGRAMHTATLLQDGRVLIAGGVGADNKPLASAEIFDPGSGTFTATGSMTTPRAFHSATLLSDGRVLMVGGSGSSLGSSSPSGGADAAVQSAEIFDPSSGTFTAVPAKMIAPRILHTATLLQDGRVLIAGGEDLAGGGALSTAELFDPAAGTFTKTGDMVAALTFHAAARLQDGRVILAGFPGSLTDLVSSGSGSSATPKPGSNDPLGGAQIYDPSSGTFATVQVEPAVLPSFALPSPAEGTPVAAPSQ